MVSGQAHSIESKTISVHQAMNVDGRGVKPVKMEELITNMWILIKVTTTEHSLKHRIRFKSVSSVS